MQAASPSCKKACLRENTPECIAWSEKRLPEMHRHCMCVAHADPSKNSQGSTSVDIFSYLFPCVLRQAMDGAADYLEASTLPLPIKLALSVGGVALMNAWPVIVGLCSLRYTEKSAPA